MPEKASTTISPDMSMSPILCLSVTLPEENITFVTSSQNFTPLSVNSTSPESPIIILTCEERNLSLAILDCRAILETLKEVAISRQTS